MAMRLALMSWLRNTKIKSIIWHIEWFIIPKTLGIWRKRPLFKPITDFLSLNRNLPSTLGFTESASTVALTLINEKRGRELLTMRQLAR